MNDDLKFALFLGATAVSLIGGLVGLSEYADNRSCRIYTEQTGIETRRPAFDECYLNTAKGWMPWSEFKARAMTKEI